MPSPGGNPLLRLATPVPLRGTAYAPGHGFQLGSGRLGRARLRYARTARRFRSLAWPTAIARGRPARAPALAAARAIAPRSEWIGSVLWTRVGGRRVSAAPRFPPAADPPQDRPRSATGLPDGPCAVLFPAADPLRNSPCPAVDPTRGDTSPRPKRDRSAFSDGLASPGTALEKSPAARLRHDGRGLPDRGLPIDWSRPFAPA